MTTLREEIQPVLLRRLSMTIEMKHHLKAFLKPTDYENFSAGVISNGSSSATSSIVLNFLIENFWRIYFMGEIKLVVTEKNVSKNQNKSKRIAFLENPQSWLSKTMKQELNLTLYQCNLALYIHVRFLIETLLKEIQLVVTENNEYEYRHKSILKAFLDCPETGFSWCWWNSKIIDFKLEPCTTFTIFWLRLWWWKSNPQLRRYMADEPRWMELFNTSWTVRTIRSCMSTSKYMFFQWKTRPGTKVWNLSLRPWGEEIKAVVSRKPEFEVRDEQKTLAFFWNDRKEES